MTSWRFGRRPSRRSLWMFTTSLLPINWRKLAAIWYNCVSACQNFNAIFSDQNFRATGWFDAYLLLQTPRASRLLLRLLHPAGRPPIVCCRCCRCSLGKPGRRTTWPGRLSGCTWRQRRRRLFIHSMLLSFCVCVCAVFLRHCWALKFNQMKCCVQFARFIAAYCVLELSKVSCFKRVEGVDYTLNYTVEC